VTALSFVVPVYNGAATLEELAARIAALGIEDSELVLVNDASPDHSADVCERIVEADALTTTFVDLERNRGEHGAVLAGVMHSGGEWIVTLDDDLANPPEEAPRLLSYARSRDYDIVYGRPRRRRYALWRRAGSRFASLTAGALLGKPPGVSLSTFRCFKRSLLHGATPRAHPYLDRALLERATRVGSLSVEQHEGTESNYTLPKLASLWATMVLPARRSGAQPFHVRRVLRSR